MNVWITPLTSAAGSLGGALVGAFVGGWLRDRREQRKRRADLIDRQLQQFYRPLRALRDTTRVYSDLLSKMVTTHPVS
jgi:membrane protein YqaA with SNARE-associated domain